MAEGTLEPVEVVERAAPIVSESVLKLDKINIRILSKLLHPINVRPEPLTKIKPYEIDP